MKDKRGSFKRFSLKGIFSRKLHWNSQQLRNHSFWSAKLSCASVKATVTFMCKKSEKSAIVQKFSARNSPNKMLRGNKKGQKQEFDKVLNHRFENIFPNYCVLILGGEDCRANSFFLVCEKIILLCEHHVNNNNRINLFAYTSIPD